MLLKKIPGKRVAFTIFTFVLWLSLTLLLTACSDSNDLISGQQLQIYIRSEADLAKIGTETSHPLSGTYLLENDISLANWLPIGDETYPFTGIFDGNGRTITLNSFAVAALSEKNYLGIFSYVKGTSARAVIKNLAIVSSVNAASETASAIGLVAGYAETAEIENITL